nr:AraC family transcriptional regulator [uncultured Oscillibacter sp.]
MKDEFGTTVYDAGLRLEAYRFRRSFPKHFHEYYVVGYIEDGQGELICRDVAYALKKGDIIIYNPGDLHACAESGAALEYWGLHIPKETMLDLTGELTGQRTLPAFSQNVVSDPEAAWDFRALHEEIMRGSREFEREERLLLLLSRLLRLCGQPVGDPAPAGREAVERACAFMEGHYGERITLERLREEAGLSKSALLRAFAREKGVTPYRYLENLRVGAAKRLLEQGVPPAEAALRTGFSDQSHFTNYFSRFIGLAPGAYREMFLDKERLCHEK